MPELNLDNNYADFENAIYLYSIMHFPRDIEMAQEYCARGRLELVKQWAAETTSETLKPYYMSILARDLGLVLNSSYAKGQDKFLELSEVRRKRGLWAGNVLFQLLNKMHKDQEISVKHARIDAFELLEQGNNEGVLSWWPDSKKDYGNKTWKEFKPVCHIWGATVRIAAHISELRNKLGYQEITIQEIVRDNYKAILSLAEWIFSELEPKFPGELSFFDPEDTWFVPRDFPLPPIKEVFTLLSYKG